MPTLSRKEVEEIALLARVHLESAELEAMQAELGAILEYFGALAAVDTTDVPPMTHAVPMDLRLRTDVTAPSLPADEAVDVAQVRALGAQLDEAALGKMLFELTAAARAKGLDPEGALRLHATKVMRDVEERAQAAAR